MVADFGGIVIQQQIIKRGPGRPPKVRPPEPVIYGASGGIDMPVSAVIHDDLVQRVYDTPLPTRRLTPDTMDSWLLIRLDNQWPGAGVQQWHGRFAAFSASNEYYCVANEKAALLAMSQRHPITGRTIITEIFAWCLDDAESRLFELYDGLRLWAKGLNAAQLLVGICSDINPESLKSEHEGDYAVMIA